MDRRALVNVEDHGEFSSVEVVTVVVNGGYLGRLTTTTKSMLPNQKVTLSRGQLDRGVCRKGSSSEVFVVVSGGCGYHSSWRVEIRRVVAGRDSQKDTRPRKKGYQ